MKIIKSTLTLSGNNFLTVGHPTSMWWWLRKSWISSFQITLIRIKRPSGSKVITIKQCIENCIPNRFFTGSHEERGMHISFDTPQLPYILRECTRGGRPLSPKLAGLKISEFLSSRCMRCFFLYINGNNITIASTNKLRYLLTTLTA